MTEATKIHEAARRVRPVAGSGPARLSIVHGLVPDLGTVNFALLTMFQHPERVQIESIREAPFIPAYARYQ